MLRTFTTIALLFTGLILFAQMQTDAGPRFANEWVTAGNAYLKIRVAEDGMYRIDAATLGAAGLPAGPAAAGQLTLHHNGQVVPVELAADGLYFYGERARGEMDAYLFPEGASQQLNPRYGMYTDTAAYYLALAPAGASPVYRTDQTVSGGTPTTTVHRTAEKLFTDKHSKYYRRSSGSTIIFSHYDLAEGFGSRASNDLLSSNGSTVTSVDVPLPGSTGGEATLAIRFGLAFGDGHQQLISVGGQQLGEVSSTDWSVNDQRYAFTASGQKATVQISGQAGNQDKANLAYIRITYPASFALSGGQLPFSLPAGGELALSATGLPADARLYDLTNAGVYTPAGGAFRLPASTTERNFVLVGEFLAPAAAAPVVLEEVLPDPDANYLILSSRRLAGAGLDALATYRSSLTGGGYRVKVTYVEDVYDSFGYGLDRHPQALRNYLDAAMARAPGLEYLFIVGKGREYPDLRTTADLEKAWSTYFVPSFGLPASDNLLSALPGKVAPRLATGRLAAITPEEVALYAGKLREVERQIEQSNQTIGDLDWMKQALFLGGGQSAGEQAAIRYNLGTMEDIFEHSSLGGNVTSVFRTSSDPIETTRQEAIFERINAGISVLTFYGHSSSQGFDFNIDNPDNYKNKGKYPFMISLGCYSGDAFTQARSISERFLFLPDGGAVAFAASKGLGYISALGTYGRNIFRHLSGDTYGEGVGRAIQATVADYASSTNFTLGILLEQFSLSGDPAFRLHPRPGPDLVIDPASIAITPGVVPAQDTSFSLSLRLLNLGTKNESVPDSTRLSFSQRLPSGEVRYLRRYAVAVPAYAVDTTLSLPNLGFEAVGLNRILIAVDPDNTIAELPAGEAEANNNLRLADQEGIPLTVVANTARVAFPPAYALVGPGFELIAGTSDPLAPERSYRLQISKVATYSDLLVDEVIHSPGGVIRYQPSLGFQDSTTYYWRISPDSTESVVGAPFIWSNSNFTYLSAQDPTRVDFAVQSPGQFIEGEAENLRLSATDEKWGFTRTTNDVEIFNGLYQSREMPRFVWNGTRYNSPHPWHLKSGIQVILVDSTNNSKWYGNPGKGQYNSVAKSGDPWSFNTSNDAGRQGLMKFLDEYVQDGQYVILYSVQRGTDIEYHNSGWLQDSTTTGRTLYGLLEAEGAEQIRLLESLGSVPYTLAYQKGHGPIAETVATAQNAETYLLIPINENWKSGNYTSPPIGPSLEWNDLNLEFSSVNIGAADSCYFRLLGLHPDGRQEILQEKALGIREEKRFQFDLSVYDAAEFPYLLTSFNLFDDSERTVASLRGIYVDYRRPGDVAVSPAIAYSFPDSLEQGQLGRLEIGYENISRTDMDSLLVELVVIDAANRVTTLRERQAPVVAGASGVAAFTLPTEGTNSGLRLQLTLNPADDQAEVVRFNNFLVADLGVSVDQVAPDLKVYYDGRRIRDGELVSGKPEILIQVRDESPYRRLDDSSAYLVQLLHPDGTRETIRMADSRVDFIPAPADGENMAEVYFRPELLQDGPYTLVVQASDRSKNAAGRLEYRQSFEVINQQLITNVLTYPNPFTTQTSFVYTLTGSTPPDMFRIQIMTVSGRVVRDIDLLAYEAISVGTHQTDFKWDGTDEYGDLLANGVYLYRVITSDGNGEALEAYDNGTDQYFRNGMGKVVILR